jgi:hypothetical protein
VLLWGLLCSLFIVLINPFNDLISTTLKMLENIGGGSRVTVSKAGHFGFVEVTRGIVGIISAHVHGLVLVPLVAIPLLPWWLGWLGVYIFALFVMLIAPYYLTTELTSYWFIPLYPLCRFTSLLIISQLLILLGRLRATLRDAALIAYLCIVVIFCVLTSVSWYQQTVKQYRDSQSNVQLAEEWLVTELHRGRTILLDRYYAHVMPKLYSARLAESMENSRAFIYERSKNMFLREAFELFHTKRYLPDFSTPPSVRKVGAYDPREPNEEKLERAGAYFVVSPNIANRFVLHDGTRLNEARRREQEFLKSYYLDAMAGVPIRRFDQGTGAVIEVYELPSHKQ